MIMIICLISLCLCVRFEENMQSYNLLGLTTTGGLPFGMASSQVSRGHYSTRDVRVSSKLGQIDTKWDKCLCQTITPNG